jgi:hypothetical protein
MAKQGGGIQNLLNAIGTSDPPPASALKRAGVKKGKPDKAQLSKARQEAIKNIPQGKGKAKSKHSIPPQFLKHSGSTSKKPNPFAKGN